MYSTRKFPPWPNGLSTLPTGLPKSLTVTSTNGHGIRIGSVREPLKYTFTFGMGDFLVHK